MGLPTYADIPRLLEWQPTHGVLTVYLQIDHGDRGGGWWIALEDRLREALEEAEGSGDRELKLAVRATVDRVRARFSDRDRPPDGRGVVGFLELSRKNGRDEFHLSPAAPRRAAVASIGPRPHLQPLVELLDDNRRRGAVAVSGEKARLFEWEEATVRELGETEMLTTGDWRERKGQRNFNIPGGQVPTSSGRDLHEQRLDEHRHGFVKDVASELRTHVSERGWEGLVLFGEPKQVAELEEEMAEGTILHAERKNLVPEPLHAVGERLEHLKDELNRKREMRLLDRAEASALAGGEGSLGLAETAQSLAMGRVAHLLIASDALPADNGGELSEALAQLGANSAHLPPAELLIQRALETDARVTPVEGEAAERLSAREGAAAILRY